MHAPALQWAKRPNAPPSPTWIHVHSQQATKDHPEHVCFLGAFEQLPCHYVHQTREERGRSEPCIGDDCPRCANGSIPRLNNYAPAIVHRVGNVVKGKEVWERVVYFVPPQAIEAMEGGQQRGKLFACWRERVGGSLRFRSRFQGYAFEVNEPTFDVRLLLQHLFFPDVHSAEAVKALLNSLPRVISPPLNKPSNPDVTPMSAEERELVRRKLAEHRARQDRAASTSEADLLSKGTAEIINQEVKDQLPDGHPAKHAKKRKGGAA